jgi:transcriptional regulator with XRE-family HTH domain
MNEHSFSFAVEPPAPAPRARERSKAKPPAPKLGAVLRGLRKRQGWTLAEVSRRTGLPISTLSKVEHDRVSLSYAKLARVSEGLGVDVARLFDAPQPQPAGISGRRSITRAGEGQAADGGSRLIAAADLLDKRLAPAITEVRARSVEAGGGMVRHAGEVYAFVVEGEAELHSGLYAPVRLKAGDSIYFDASMGHAFVNVGEGPCRVLSVSPAQERLTQV